MAAVESAEIEVMDWYRRFAECEKTGAWPGYADDIIELGYDIDGMVSSVEDDIQW